MRKPSITKTTVCVFLALWFTLWIVPVIAAFVVPMILATQSQRTVTTSFLDRAPDRNTWYIRQYNHIGWAAIVWAPDVRHLLEGMSAPTYIQGVVDHRASLAPDPTRDGWPRDSHMPRQDLERKSIAEWVASRGSRMVEVSSGWPFRCVRGDFRLKDRPTDNLQDIIALRTIRVPIRDCWQDIDALGHGVAPYGIIPAGIAATGGAALGCTFAVFLGVRGVRWIRERARRSRNSCPACGYALAKIPGLVCPECGARADR